MLCVVRVVSSTFGASTASLFVRFGGVKLFASLYIVFADNSATRWRTRARRRRNDNNNNNHNYYAKHGLCRDWMREQERVEPNMFSYYIIEENESSGTYIIIIKLV